MTKAGVVHVDHFTTFKKWSCGCWIMIVYIYTMFDCVIGANISLDVQKKMLSSSSNSNQSAFATHMNETKHRKGTRKQTQSGTLLLPHTPVWEVLAQAVQHLRMNGRFGGSNGLVEGKSMDMLVKLEKSDEIWTFRNWSNNHKHGYNGG